MKTIWQNALQTDILTLNTMVSLPRTVVTAFTGEDEAKRRELIERFLLERLSRLSYLSSLTCGVREVRLVPEGREVEAFVCAEVSLQRLSRVIPIAEQEFLNGGESFLLARKAPPRIAIPEPTGGNFSELIICASVSSQDEKTLSRLQSFVSRCRERLASDLAVSLRCAVDASWLAERSQRGCCKKEKVS